MSEQWKPKHWFSTMLHTLRDSQSKKKSIQSDRQLQRRTVHHTALLHCSTLLSCPPLCCTLIHSTLLYSTLLNSSLLHPTYPMLHYAAITSARGGCSARQARVHRNQWSVRDPALTSPGSISPKNTSYLPALMCV